MEQIGAHLPAAKPSPKSQSVQQGKRSGNLIPFPETDKLGRQLIVWTDTHGNSELSRALTEVERQQLESRVRALDDCLLPFAEDQAHQIRTALAAMLSGFRQMARAGDETLDVTMAVLSNLPAWAIIQACLNFARSGATWPPSDAEIYAAADNLTAPRRMQLWRARRVLSATVAEGRDGKKPAQKP